MIPPGVLARVPGCEGGAAPLALEPLEGGSVNRAFRVVSPTGVFVVRLDSAAAAVPGIDRRREWLLQARAARAGLAPQIVHASAASGCTITCFVAGERLDAASLCAPGRGEALLAEALRRLHALEAPALAPFDLLAAARDYARRIAGPEPHGAPEVAAELEAIAAALQRAGSRGRPAAVVHLDLHHSNLIVRGDHLVLLDWEFANVGDPLLDLACWLAYYPSARSRSGELLRSLGLGACSSPQMLEALTEAFGRVSALWYRARHPPAAARSGAAGAAAAAPAEAGESGHSSAD